MSPAAAAIVGAAIGAIASVAGTVAQAVLRDRADTRRRRDERSSVDDQRRQALVQSRLFQLQDAVTSLRQRLENWERRGGQTWSESVQPGYWQVTTLYAFARALGAERLLLLDGLHAELDRLFDGLGQFLKIGHVDRAVASLVGTLFYYDRVALAESVLLREPGGYRLRTYIEWRQLYGDEALDLSPLVRPAATALTELQADSPRMASAGADLTDCLRRLEAATQVPILPVESEPGADRPQP